MLVKTPLINYHHLVMNNNITTTLYPMPKEKLVRKLKNRVVTYHNLGKSTVKADGVRQLVIKEIDHIGYSQEEGRRYIQGKVQDLDDGGEAKFRTLHVAGITNVKGRLATAWALAKSVF